LTIAIRIALPGVRHLGTIVTGITDTVTVVIGLPGIGDGGTIVQGHADLIEIFVGAREADPPLIRKTKLFRDVARAHSTQVITERQGHIKAVVGDEIAIHISVDLVFVDVVAEARAAIAHSTDPVQDIRVAPDLPRMQKVVALSEGIHPHEGGGLGGVVTLVELPQGLRRPHTGGTVVVPETALAEIKIAVEVPGQGHIIDLSPRRIGHGKTLLEDGAVEPVATLYGHTGGREAGDDGLIDPIPVFIDGVGVGTVPVGHPRTCGLVTRLAAQKGHALENRPDRPFVRHIIRRIEGGVCAAGRTPERPISVGVHFDDP
jgi:hypothetical protein